ncbi:hypothetical protein L1987_27508 [Smallanthus sonchifolius]|uniref:Uncharacterized protein n=1 Tax=Smallanthus sonchifolius TaxID=185202 RepID=A0ACB9IBE7_9ASTR|nr:hypothetical protein L1987_27508 [Smallanthus sonchifolius]
MPNVSLSGDLSAQGELGGEGNKGDDQQVNENVDVEEIVDKETLECLIDLDSVLIDDWESDAEDVEKEFEQDDEVVNYSTNEGVEFDTSFIDQINQLARDNEEGDIIEVIEKENDPTEKTDYLSVNLSNMT